NRRAEKLHQEVAALYPGMAAADGWRRVGLHVLFRLPGYRGPAGLHIERTVGVGPGLVGVIGLGIACRPAGEIALEETGRLPFDRLHDRGAFSGFVKLWGWCSVVRRLLAGHDQHGDHDKTQER